MNTSRKLTRFSASVMMLTFTVLAQLAASAADDTSAAMDGQAAAPIKVGELNERPVLGDLGQPLGKLVTVAGVVANGDFTRKKADVGGTLLRIQTVDGRPLKPEVIHHFAPSPWVKIERPAVGSRFKYIGYETGEFTGSPAGEIKYIGGSNATTTYHFTTSFVILKDARADNKELEMLLPRDPATVVIRLEYVGGYREDPKVTLGPDGKAIVEEDKPALEIKADGTVLKKGKVVRKMTVDDLKKLLTFIAIENKFYEFDQAAVEATIKDKQKAFAKSQKAAGKQVIEVREVPADMATPTITVQLGEKKKTVGCYGIGFYDQWYGDSIKPIRQMLTIQQKLQSL